MSIAIEKEQSNYSWILNDIETFYPDFQNWYQTKVIPGLVNGSREILTEYRKGKLVGIGIIKKDPQEKKICTIKVIPEYANRGIGIKIFKRALKSLDCNKPLVSVPEERFEEFHKIFTHYNFELTQVLESYYRNGKKEFIYNGLLK